MRSFLEISYKIHGTIITNMLGVNGKYWEYCLTLGGEETASSKLGLTHII